MHKIFQCSRLYYFVYFDEDWKRGIIFHFQGYNLRVCVECVASNRWIESPTELQNCKRRREKGF